VLSFGLMVVRPLVADYLAGFQPAISRWLISATSMKNGFWLFGQVLTPYPNWQQVLPFSLNFGAAKLDF
jgi:hypothetical protein